LVSRPFFSAANVLTCDFRNADRLSLSGENHYQQNASMTGHKVKQGQPSLDVRRLFFSGCEVLREPVVKAPRSMENRLQKTKCATSLLMPDDMAF
jgi:hypothetical protein